MQTEEGAYCFWDALSFQDTVVLTCHGVIAFFILILSCYRLFKFRSLDDDNDHLLSTCIKIHLLVGLWALMFFIQNTYSTAIFFLDLNDGEVPTIPQMSGYSKVYAVIDKIPPFIIQSIFIQVCLFNYRGILGTIRAEYLKVNHKFFKTYLRIINYGRVVVVGIGILSLLIFQGDQQIWTTSNVNIAIQVADSLLIFFILLYSVRQFVRKGLQQDVVRPSIRSQMKKEYALMIFSDVLGVISSFLFLIYYPFISPVKRVSDICLQPFEEHLQFFVGHNILGMTAVHLIPIFWFLSMYNYKGQTEHDNSFSSLSDLHDPLINASNNRQHTRR